jgi:recombination protein RecT
METKQLTVKTFFEADNVKKKFADLLGKKAQGFITSVLQVVNSNDLLVKATPESVYNAAATAATLELPINNN